MVGISIITSTVTSDPEGDFVLVPGHLNQPTKPFANSLASASSLIAKSGAPEPATPGTAGAGASDTIAESSLKKAKKMKRVVRTGGGQMWEDNSLKEWDVNDYR
jgi:hypothetical protein